MFLFSINIHAQIQQKIDSLKHVIAIAQNDTIKLAALAGLNSILNQDRTQLKAGLNQQIELSKKLKDYKNACAGYAILAYLEFENNNFIAAENITKEGMELAKQINDLFEIAKLADRLMLIYDKKGDMAMAVNYLKEGEELLLKLNKIGALSKHYCNASDVYVNHNMLSKALEYARKAYAAVSSTGEQDPIATTSWYLASRLQMVGKPDSALYFFSQGLKIAEKLEYVYTQADMLRGLSDAYTELKQYEIARQYLKKAVIMYDSVKVTERSLACEESLAYLDFMNKDFTAVKNYIHTREIGTTEDSLNNNRYINKWLANLALIDHDLENWKKYFNRYEQADVALANDKIRKNLLELEAKYNLSKKESELLQKENENRKRLWIIAVLALGLFSIIGIAVTQYHNNINKQQIAAQKAIIEKQNALGEERLRIAADMHDDVGAGLSRIRYITASMKGKESMNNEDIDKVVSLSDESVEKMNEIIWALNQGNQQLDELIYFTRSQCSEMVSNAGLEFSFDLPENIPSKILAWKDCRNIYLLVKESVNNAIKHAEARRIIIECNLTTQLLFSIADDGVGFNVEASGKNGNGLLNYKKRIEKLNGTYQLITAPGKGTKIIFSIPIGTFV